MTRPNLRVLPSLDEAEKLPSVPPPWHATPSDHFHAYIQGAGLYSIRTTARLAGAKREWERAKDAAGRARWAAEYVARWCAAEFERTGIMPAEPTTVPATPAPAIAPASTEDQADDTPELPLDLEAAAVTLGPFLERTRAEVAGVYCLPLAWPERAGLVHDPAEHWARFRDRFPLELAGVLRPLAAAWAAGDRPLADGWPVAAEHFRFEYSRLVAWFKASPADVPAQLEAWAEGITGKRNPIATMAIATAPKQGPERCLCCKGREWWKASISDAPWVCATCHPPARPELVSERHGEPAAPSMNWGKHAEAIARLEQLRPDDLPSSFTLRPGFTVTDGARFLASLQAQAAQGAGGVRARRGVLLADVADLLQAIAPLPAQSLAEPDGDQRAPD